VFKILIELSILKEKIKVQVGIIRRIVIRGEKSEIELGLNKSPRAF
jgi:hypothetical protein